MSKTHNAHIKNDNLKLWFIRFRLRKEKNNKSHFFKKKYELNLQKTCKHFKRNMKLNPVIWVEGNFTHRWFSLSNSEKVNPGTLQHSEKFY